MENWYDEYEKLDLLNGKISFTSEDDKDMIEIHYEDGMLIDVGYISHLNSYVITVVSSDTEEGRKNPLEAVKIENKAELFDKIQETIYTYREMNYQTFVTELFNRIFFCDLKESRKKHGLIGAIGILLLLCVIRGFGQKYIWQGSFWEGFLYPFALFFVIFIIFSILHVLMKKAPKLGSVVIAALLILCVVFLLGIFLLLIVLLLNSFLHFWF